MRFNEGDDGVQVGSFSLKVRREIGKPAPPPKPVAAGPPVLGKAMVESIPADSVPAASKPTKPKLALSTPSLKPISNFSSMEAAADAGLVFVTSPKVWQHNWFSLSLFTINPPCFSLPFFFF